MNSNRSLVEREAVSLGKLAWVVPLATAVAVTANITFYTIITRWFHIGLRFPSDTPERSLSATMAVGDVVLFSVIFALGAGFVFVIVTQSARRPIRTYLMIATAVLFVSFLLPLKIPSPPVAMIDKLSLVAMHIIGAIAVVGVLVGLGRK
jgi:presenilin-like A22 family membrane protease